MIDRLIEFYAIAGTITMIVALVVGLLLRKRRENQE